ncbi:MAG: GerMN domain-containing protein [Vicinamibacterales bacterium]
MTTRRVMLALGVAVVAVALGWWLFDTLGRRLAEPPPDADVAPVKPAAAPSAAPHIAATLFFVAEDGVSLQGVAADVPLKDTPAAQAKALVEAQLAAEPPDTLTRAVPAGAAVRGVFLTGRDDAYVDLDGAFAANLAGGSRNELLATYAIVSVVTTNLTSVSRVQLLIDGREVESLTGHVDLREPLRKNDSLIRTP